MLVSPFTCPILFYYWFFGDVKTPPIEVQFVLLVGYFVSNAEFAVTVFVGLVFVAELFCDVPKEITKGLVTILPILALDADICITTNDW